MLSVPNHVIYNMCYQLDIDEALSNDIRFKYFMSCKDTKATVLPILHKV
jgi:hypothetical protein